MTPSINSKPSIKRSHKKLNKTKKNLQKKDAIRMQSACIYFDEINSFLKTWFAIMMNGL